MLYECGSSSQGDWSEFNQCQSQLGALYDEGFSGCKSEFLAYRILYHMMTNESAGKVCNGGPFE